MSESKPMRYGITFGPRMQMLAPSPLGVRPLAGRMVAWYGVKDRRGRILEKSGHVVRNDGESLVVLSIDGGTATQNKIEIVGVNDHRWRLLNQITDSTGRVHT